MKNKGSEAKGNKFYFAATLGNTAIM